MQTARLKRHRRDIRGRRVGWGKDACTAQGCALPLASSSSRRLNPKKRVPVLSLDGEIITEVPAIATAIASLAPERHLIMTQTYPSYTRFAREIVKRESVVAALAAEGLGDQPLGRPPQQR